MLVATRSWRDGAKLRPSMGTVELVLLHSPLVGPGFWRPVSEVLQARWHCWLPAVANDDELASWRDWPSAATAELSIGPGAIVVGHSAAGFLLPSVAHLLNASGLVFVDALIPPDSGFVPPADPEFLQFVRSLPCENGLLPRWSRWWGEGAIERLIGDAQAYERFERELPRLPVAWFDDRLEIPPWRHLRAGYLATSERFAPSARDAQTRSWPVLTLAGTHLHPFVAPRDTASALSDIIQSLTSVTVRDGNT